MQKMLENWRFRKTWRIFLKNSAVSRPLYTESEIFACVFPFFRIPHPFLSKCMQRMRKRRKSNLIRIFFDRRKFRRQCANVIDTTCENFGRKFQTQCAETLTVQNKQGTHEQPSQTKKTAVDHPGKGSGVWPSMVTHNRNLFSAFNPSKCTLTAVNTHLEQWAAILRRPGSSWGIGALLKGLTSVVVLKVERALVIHSPHRQSLPDLGIEPATFGLQVQLSNH